MNTKIAFILIPLLYSIAHGMDKNQNSKQNPLQQVLQQLNQRTTEIHRQRTVDNCMMSGQPIPSQLISSMHPAQAAAAHIYNTNLICQKK